MPDEMDAIQERVQRDTDALIAQRAPAMRGRTTCASDGCDAPINAERTALGAQFCMECQREIDARNARAAPWARRQR